MFLLLAACHAPVPPPDPADLSVRSRPGEAIPGLGPGARVDRGLRTAAEALAGAASSPEAWLDPNAVRGALELGRYPGAARFVRMVGGPEFPEALLADVPRGADVDLGWAFREFAGGARWWVLGWAPRRLTLDPVPGSVPLGGGIGVRAEGAKSPRLFVLAPSGRWREASLSGSGTRWIGNLAERGDWRFEVVDGERVELLWGLHVGEEIPVLSPLSGPRQVENPITGPEALYAKVNELRKINGLKSLERFPTFEPLVREQAACLADGGVAAHQSDLCPGVSTRATQHFYPRGHFHEDVAVATTVNEAWSALLGSPGHVANLLCKECTHLSIGAAIEPVAEPRLFVVWEVMAFPEGSPRPIDPGH